MDYFAILGCQSTEFQCNDQSAICISIADRCDVIADCPNGEDEVGCDVATECLNGGTRRDGDPNFCDCTTDFQGEFCADLSEKHLETVKYCILLIAEVIVFFYSTLRAHSVCQRN